MNCTKILMGNRFFRKFLESPESLTSNLNYSSSQYPNYPAVKIKMNTCWLSIIFDQIEPNDFMGTCICISYMQIQICATNSARVFPAEKKW